MIAVESRASLTNLMTATIENAEQEREMDVKEAVQIAKKYVIDLFEEEGISDIGLEEVVFASNSWTITIGFSRPWNRNIGSVLGGQVSRSYKALRIQDEDGQVLSVKDRALGDSE